MTKIEFSSEALGKVTCVSFYFHLFYVAFLSLVEFHSSGLTMSTPFKVNLTMYFSVPNETVPGTSTIIVSFKPYARKCWLARTWLKQFCYLSGSK